jgi:GTP-binding protein
LPFCIIFTKADKISKGKVEQSITAYRKKLLANNWEEMPQHFVTSSTEGTGKDKVLEYINEINEEIFKSNDSFL